MIVQTGLHEFPILKSGMEVGMVFQHLFPCPTTLQKVFVTDDLLFVVWTSDYIISEYKSWSGFHGDSSCYLR